MCKPEGGEKEMRKMLLIPLILCMVALLPTLWMPAVHATPPITGSGWFDQLIPEEGGDPPRIVGDNIITHVWGGGGTLYGFMEGVWIHDEWVVVHLADGIVTLNGVWDTPEGVTVNGVYEGTVHVSYGGTVDLATGVFQGNWVIISGTGDLANLRGQGTVCFDPANPPFAWYTGLYHFDP